jgi:putative ubiquitin-RnfH superfamily antitoxin RatB of RatAB toxin-antitoxin module
MAPTLKNIEVAYGLPNKQVVIPLAVSDTTTVLEAINLSGIQAIFPELDNINPSHIGVYGKKIDVNTYILKQDDRIEIYRPLTKTPNQIRLERAKK